jgi:hypothetical protein
MVIAAGNCSTFSKIKAKLDLVVESDMGLGAAGPVSGVSTLALEPTTTRYFSG